MPTNRKRVARGRTEAGGITEGDFIFFSWGDFFEAEGYAEGKTEEELKQFWNRHKNEIMTRYLEDNHRSGAGWEARRPWSWWRWEAPEPKGKTPPGDLCSKKEWDEQQKKYDWVESDFEYLQRLNLLEPWERNVHVA